MCPADAHPADAHPEGGARPDAGARPDPPPAAVRAGPLVEVRARGMVMTDGPLSRPVPVVLCYDPAAEPRPVRFVLPGGSWTCPRALLERGLRAPVRDGDVGLWPCGRVQTVVELRSPKGTAVVQFDSSALRGFLRRTYTAATSPVTR